MTRRVTGISRLLIIGAALGLTTANEVKAEGTVVHPLQVHMNQWLTGSRDWRTPNPDYEAPESPGEEDQGWKEFSVTWDWDEATKIMLGELSGVRADGSRTRFWKLYSFYNPVTERVLYLQISRRGDMIRGEDPVRRSPVAFGETERLDTMSYSSSGKVKYTRHENVFSENGTHISNVFERTENGQWEQVDAWTWTLTNSPAYQ